METNVISSMGVSFKRAVKINNTEMRSSGISQLVNLLTRQLNGVMREEGLNGTRVMFEFRLTRS